MQTDTTILHSREQILIALRQYSGKQQIYKEQSRGVCYKDVKGSCYHTPNTIVRYHSSHNNNCLIH